MRNIGLQYRYSTDAVQKGTFQHRYYRRATMATWRFLKSWWRLYSLSDLWETHGDGGVVVKKCCGHPVFTRSIPPRPTFWLCSRLVWARGHWRLDWCGPPNCRDLCGRATAGNGSLITHVIHLYLDMILVTRNARLRRSLTWKLKNYGTSEGGFNQRA